ncbi:phosphatidic acid phosphatase type 2/haloperoxidase, partial [Glomus cerebriforme]
ISKISIKFLVSILKQIIRQPRPYHATITIQPSSQPAIQKQRKSFGMPSSHSAIIIYFATFITLQLFNVASPLVKLFSFLMVFIIGLLVLWSRVELGHHTTAQVLMGMLLGIILAVFWNNLWVNH